MTNNNWPQDLYIKAYRFAANAHRGQFVPGTDVSYVMHLSFVSMEVIAALNTESNCDGALAVPCSLLHDVIEDTDTVYAQVVELFGVAVADGVLALTKDQAVEKSLRMADSLRRIKQQPKEVWMVKMADRITNLQPPPPDWSKEKAARYRDEAIAIHEALREASGFLAERLLEKIEAYRAYT